MIIPEDGCLPSITSSNLNAFNNIMIVKVDDKSITPGGTTFQLATLDRSKKGTIWPADNYINKLIPGLPEIKVLDEQKKEFESRKELNLSMKTTTIRPKLFQPPDQIKYHFSGTQKSNFPGKKTSADRSEKFNKRFLSKSEIDKIEPWTQKPWENPTGLLPDPDPSLLKTPSNINYHLPFIPNEGYYGSCLPGELDSAHHSFSSALPSSGSYPKMYPGYIREHSLNINPYVNKFDEMALAGSSNHYSNNNFRPNLRSRPNANRHYKNNSSRNPSNRGSRHDSVTNYRNNYDSSFVHEHDYSGNDNIGKHHHISPITFSNNYVPDSRRDLHSSFEAAEMENSIVYDNVGKMRNNSNNTTFQTQHSRGRNNRRQRRNNSKFMHHANPRENVNSKMNMNSIPRGNGESSIARDQWNSGQRFNTYDKNLKKPWMTNKNQNFKQAPYNVNQKAFKNFRGSNIRP